MKNRIYIFKNIPIKGIKRVDNVEVSPLFSFNGFSYYGKK